jgi:crotonobetainyl-CoA:carnitine CoA-transferase CaiB-like acyl-CoA transferase
VSSLDTEFAGLKVVDLTTNVAGPFAARFFAELGADVVHVEPPYGDDGRNGGPVFLFPDGGFHAVGNRNKRGMVLDIKTLGGRAVLRHMLDRCDIFIENMSKGTLDELDLGYQKLRRTNPRLIQVSITGWGQKGPLGQEPGYDVLVQAFAGLMRWSRTAEESPEIVGLRGDPTAPLLAALATMVALRRRERTGEGALVTSSVLQGGLEGGGAGLVVAEEDPTTPATGRGAGSVAGLGPFRAKDGEWVFLCAYSDRQFRRLCELAGFPEIGEDPQYSPRPKRSGATGDRLNALLTHWVSTKSHEEVIEAARALRIPVSPLRRSVHELLNDPHVLANDMVVVIDHPTKGRIWQVGALYEIDGEHPTFQVAPTLGQHTDEVLGDYGFSAKDIARLHAEGAVS